MGASFLFPPPPYFLLCKSGGKKKRKKKEEKNFCWCRARFNAFLVQKQCQVCFLVGLFRKSSSIYICQDNDKISAYNVFGKKKGKKKKKAELKF